MMFRSILGGLGTLAMLAGSAAAAPATPEQATEIRSALQRYVGRGEGDASPVAVVPKDDSYAISIDLKRSLAWLDRFGIAIDAAPYAVTATPLEGGTWHVVSAAWPQVTVHYGAQSYTVVMNGAAFDGVFDPSLPGFATSSLSYDSMSVGALGDQGETQTRQINKSKQTSTATANGPGLTDLRAVQSNAGFNQQIVLAGPPAGAAKVSNGFSVQSESTSGHLAVDRLHARALLDLWAFLVAHATEDQLKKSQAELRDGLSQALPLFDHFDQSGATENLSVETALGHFAARSLEGRLRVSGLVAQGEVNSELRVADLSIPAGLVPPWGETLVPVSGELNQSVSGFHLDAPARMFVDTFDLNAKNPIPPDTVQKLTGAFGGLDGIVLTIAPSHLASKTVDLRLDGTVRLNNLSPEGRFNVRAKGLDQAMAAIQSAGANDPVASQVLSVLVLAKGLGKAEPDGSLTWLVASGAAGTTVNGLSLPGMGTK